MNIESTNLSSITPSNVIVENVSAPVVDGVVVSEGFSEALVAQMGLLNNMKTESPVSLQTPEQAVLPSVNNSPSTAELPVSKIDTQDFAALLGNDLPPTYQTKDDTDHQAALAAVTDTLKYIASGAAADTAVTKMAEAAQSIKDQIAMAMYPQQDTKATQAVAVPAEQNVQNVQNAVEKIVPVVVEQTVQVEQRQPEEAVSRQPEVAIASRPKIAVANQPETAPVVVVEQNLKDAPVQVNLQQSNQQLPDKKAQDQTEAPTVAVTANTDSQRIDELLATVILPALTPVPVEQGKPVNNLTPSNSTVTEDELLSFIKPSLADGKTNPITKESTDAVNTAAVSRQPDQIKQDFNLNLKYFENAGQAENTGQFEKTVHVEQPVLSIDGEKTLPRVATEIVQPNKPAVDNKVDVPAITKPLSHPEWNKDIGERIVWMSSKAIPSAEIRLNPQHLGPISVRVDVTDDKATVAFTAQHAVVRETLEASIPKLREMMSAQQLNLVEVNVSQGSASNQGHSQSQTFAQSSGRGQGAAEGIIDGVDDVEQEIESGRAIVSKGLLSLYA